MDDLLRKAFTNEGLRRMARKAGVSSTREKDFILNDEVRVVAEIMLKKHLRENSDLCGLP